MEVDTKDTQQHASQLRLTLLHEKKGGAGMHVGIRYAKQSVISYRTYYLSFCLSLLHFSIIAFRFI